MLKTKISLLVILAVFFSMPTMADSYYVGAYSSLGKIHNEGRKSDNSAFKAVAGIRIHPQWAVEFGYADFGKVDPVSDEENTTFKNGFSATGYSFSLLGIAESQTGMLYYKLGTTKLDGEQILFNQSSCEGATLNGDVTRCEVSIDDTAFTLGLGWEQRLTKSWSLRAEYERVNGSGDLEIENAYFGVTYRF